MRRSPNVRLLTNKKDEPYGVVLSADFTAEHEWGIEGLARHLGVPRDGAPGLDGRTMSKGFADTPSRVFYKTNTSINKAKCDILCSREFTTYSNEDVKNIVSPRYGDEAAFTALWSREGFSLAAWTDEAKIFLGVLYQALLDGDVAVWIGGVSRNPFERGGLVIAIASLVDEEDRETMLNADLARIALQTAADETGIKQRIDEKAAQTGAGLISPFSTYALSPRWATELENHAGVLYSNLAKYPVVFFLNPFDQKNNNYGWFTVEELDQWIDGNGPVVKSGKGARR